MTQLVDGLLDNYSEEGKDATEDANADLSEYIAKNKDAYFLVDEDLTDLQDGAIPQKYRDAMEDSINSTVQKTLGTAVNEFAMRGVLNSSVTNMAINNIARNAADITAQNFLNNINVSQNLAQSKWGDAITTDRENANMTLQQLNNIQLEIDRNANLAQRRQRRHASQRAKQFGSRGRSVHGSFFEFVERLVGHGRRKFICTGRYRRERHDHHDKHSKRRRLPQRLARRHFLRRQTMTTFQVRQPTFQQQQQTTSRKSPLELMIMQQAMAQNADAKTLAGFAFGKLLRGIFDDWKERYTARGDLKAWDNTRDAFGNWLPNFQTPQDAIDTPATPATPTTPPIQPTQPTRPVPQINTDWLRTSRLNCRAITIILIRINGIILMTL